MKVTIYNHHNQGTIIAPSSKSITHRALLCAAFHQKPVTIINPLLADDTLATMKALETIGASFEMSECGILVTPIKLSKRSSTLEDIIDCHDSATTFRLLVPILACFYQQFTLRCSDQLAKRLCLLPLSADGFTYQVDGNLFTFTSMTYLNTYHIDKTSQTVSGLIYSLRFHQDVSLVITCLQFDPYLKLTLDTLASFGHHYIVKPLDNGYHIQYEKYDDPHILTFRVEGDYSSAANFLVQGLFGRITVTNLPMPSSQADALIVDVIRAFNGQITISENQITTSRSHLRGCHFNLDTCRDIAPLVIALACVSQGTSHLFGLNRLKYKESDRLTKTVELLTAAGASIIQQENCLIIEGNPILKCSKPLCVASDHRLLMMLASISSTFTTPIVFIDGLCVNKSYPQYYHDYSLVGGVVKWEK